MVFDNNAERAMQFFQELLFKHYASASEADPEIFMAAARIGL
jgi:hypothetical protein